MTSDSPRRPFEEGLFTRFVQDLRKNREVRDTAQLEQIWSAIRHLLRRELRRRGLWLRQPHYLGILGAQTWWDRSGEGDPLEELTAIAYAYIFVERLSNLLAHVELKPNIEGIVFRNVSNLVHDLQKKHDPLGFGLFSFVREALAHLVERGRLVAESSAAIDGQSVLSFLGKEAEPASPTDLEPIVESWCGILLPRLMSGRRRKRLRSELESCIMSLEDQGVASFQVGDLVNELKSAIRRHWSHFMNEAGVARWIDEDRETSIKGAFELPDQVFEDSQCLRLLTECVDRELGKMAASSASLRAKSLEVQALWRLLLDWALDSANNPLDPNKVPSRRGVSRELDISRDRIETSYRHLRRIIEQCQQEIGTGDAASSGAPVPSAGASMNPEDTKSLLREATLQALDRASQAGREAISRGPSQGDVYLLAATAELDIEWLVLDIVEQEGDVQARLVPVDTFPETGPRDLRLPSEQPAGAAVLRCGEEVTVPIRLLESGSHVRSSSPETVKEVERLRASTHETDEEASPELENWLAQLTEAREILLRASRFSSSPAGEIRPVQARILRWRSLAAAALLLISVGLLWQNLSQRERLDRLSRPQIDPPIESLRFPIGDRGPVEILRTPDTRYGLLLLRGLAREECRPLRLTLSRPAGGTIWQSPELTIPPSDQVPVVLPGPILDLLPLELVIHGLCEDPPRRLYRLELESKTAPGPAADAGE